MSQQHNHWLSQWQVVSDHLRCTSFRRDSLVLSKRDNATWAEALLLQGMLLQDLALSTTVDFRHAKSWCYSVASVDCTEVCRVMKECDGWLVSLLEKPGAHSYADFKHQLITKWRQAGLILSPVKHDMIFIDRSFSIERFRALHQFFTFGARVSLRDIPNDSVIRDFVVDDEGLRRPNADLAKALNRVMRDWLSGFEVDSIPSHGPGSTADAGKVSLLAKYDHLGSDSLLDYVLRRHGFSAEEFSPLGLKPWSRTAKLQCVPKTALVQRTICMEPATLQYYQQMVRRSLYDFMGRTRKIRCHINLIDQTVNREAARIGSFDGTISTIDLSKASDSVTWDLARTAFAGTALLPWLYATRSRWVEYQPGKRLKVKKFAPMGSALCFPVECLIFAGICECAVRDYGKLCSSRYYSVYGDDIAIETELVPVVISYLEQLGFTVNRDKSFTRYDVLNFRESCGGEFIGGEDVSPLRLPRRFQGGKIDAHHPGLYEDYIALANSCWDKGFLGCRRWLITRLHSVPRHLRPVFGPGGSSLSTFTGTNYRLIRRWSSRYQAYQVKHGIPKTMLEPTDISAEKCRLYHWFAMAELNPERSSEIESKIGPVKRPVLESTWSLDHWV